MTPLDFTIDDFDHNQYLSKYADLNSLIKENDDEYNKEILWNHWIEYGRKQGRIVCRKIVDSFNHNIYLINNPDLQKLAENENPRLRLWTHYNTKGIHENRNLDIVPYDFNLYEYFYLNPDLKNMNENEAKKHYYKHGYYENRKYKVHNYKLNTLMYLHIDDISTIDIKYKNLFYEISKIYNLVISYEIGIYENTHCLMLKKFELVNYFRSKNDQSKVILIKDIEKLENFVKNSYDFNFIKNSLSCSNLISFSDSTILSVKLLNKLVLKDQDMFNKLFTIFWCEYKLFEFILDNKINLNYINYHEYIFIEGCLKESIKKENSELKLDILISYRIANPDLLKLNICDLIAHYNKYKSNDKRSDGNFIPNLNSNFELYKDLYLTNNNISNDFDFRSYLIPLMHTEEVHKIINSKFYYTNSVNHYKENLLKYTEIYSKYKIFSTVDDYQKSELNSNDILFNNLVLENFYNYSTFNQDLSAIDSKNRYLHFIENEKNRKYTIYDENTIFNNCVFFINHSSELTGAPIYLYNLIKFINKNNIFSNIILLEVYPNTKLDSMLKDLNCKIMYYYNNVSILKKLLHKYNPLLIYSNSQIYPLKTGNLSKYFHKTLFHFHETWSGNFTIKYILNKNEKLYKSYVCADVINNEYKKNGVKSGILPPFLNTEKLNIMDLCMSNYKKSTNEQIVFGMCGTKSHRKGYDIFLSILKKMPQHKFIWIGSEYDNSNVYENYVQIPETNDPYTPICNEIDYMLITSRDDPCPFVILETFYLQTPCIILDKNIKYSHENEVKENYYVIKNHNNDPNNVVEYLNKMNLTKKNKENNLNLKKYIINKFTSPKIFINQEPDSVNRICLFLSLYNLNDENFKYYKNLISVINITYNFKIDIVLLINTGAVFNNDFTYYNNEKYTLFGVKDNENISKLYEKYKNFNYKKIIFVPNKGTDFGPFLIGLNNCGSEYEYIFKLHSKTNIYWREMMNKIIYLNVLEENPNIDTFTSKTWFNDTDIHEDDNCRLLLQNNSLFNIRHDEWSYSGGSVFITKFRNLELLKEKFVLFYNFLDDINSTSHLWVEKMNDKEFFDKQYEFFRKCKWNKSIDIDSYSKRKELNCKNYFQLAKHGYRGLPDFSETYAMERYVGYLICRQKKIYFY